MIVPEKIGKIRLIHENTDPEVNSFYLSGDAWKNGKELNYTKYQIKETDHRIKTATFTSPDYIDLTTGRYFILISSKYHENFSGVVLDVDYDPETGVYNYQCQDWSRTYMITPANRNVGTTTIYTILIDHLTKGDIWPLYNNSGTPFPDEYPNWVLKYYKDVLSGLKPIEYYNQSLYPGNRYTGNPFKQKPKMLNRGKTHIEIIRALVFSQLGYFDVWFNDRGILQIEPLSKTDWESTGLHLTTGTAMKEKYKFSTTNAITRVFVNYSGAETGKGYNLDELKSGVLNLQMFFGRVSTSISDPIQRSSTTASTSSKKTTTNTTGNSDNPYGTKNKEVWVNMDHVGSQSQDLNYLNKVCELLKQNGWKVHNMGRSPTIHSSESYFSQCHDGIWWTIDGGMDPGTIRHLGYDSWCAGSIMKKGGRCVFACMLDHPETYWVEKGCGNWYDLGKAWDDNYSGADTYLKYPAGYMAWSGLPFMTAKNFDANGMVAQFLKGGCSQEALKMSNWKNHKGNYYIRSGWPSTY